MSELDDLPLDDAPPCSLKGVEILLGGAVESLRAGTTHMLFWDLCPLEDLKGLDIWSQAPLAILSSDGGKPIGYGMVTSSDKATIQMVQGFIQRECPDRLTFETEPGRMHLAPVVLNGRCVALQFRLGPWKGPINAVPKE